MRFLIFFLSFTSFAYASGSFNVSKSDPADAGISKIEIPSLSSAPCQKEHDVYAELKNFGAANLVKVTIQWSVNDTAQPPLEWSGVLLSGEQTLINLGKGNLLLKSSNVIKAWVESPNDLVDINSANDLFTLTGIRRKAAGTFTIGGQSPDFSTITEAAAMLNDVGVCDDVTFLIRSGIYSEHISIGLIDGTSNNNRVTFRSETGERESVTVQFEGSTDADDYVWHLENTGFITIRDLTIRAVDEVHSTGIVLKGSLDRVQIINNKVEVMQMIDFAAGYRRRCISAIDATLNGCAIKGNDFSGGREGIWLWSDHPEVVVERDSIIGNVFHDQEFSISLWETNNFLITGNNVSHGIFFYKMHDCNVLSNEIGTGASQGITINQCSGLEVLSNKVVVESTGIYLESSEDVFVANNFITTLDRPGTYITNSIEVDGGSGYKLFHNSVLNFEDGSGAALSLRNLQNANDVEIKNNILHNPAGEASIMLVNVDLNQAGLRSDFNDVIGNFYAVIVFRAGEPRLSFSNISQWNSFSGLEAHSISVNPLFASKYDLHASASALVGKATPVSVETDIDGVNRNPLYPTIGADEFGTSAMNDVSLVAIDDDFFCHEEQSISFMIRNNGLRPILHLKIEWSINGVAQAPIDWLFSPEISYDNTSRYFLPYTIYALNKIHTVEVLVYDPDQIDENSNDNTIKSIFTIHEPVEIGTEQIIGCNGSAKLTASGKNFFSSYLWTDLDDFHSEELTVEVSKAGLYILEVMDTNQCVSRDSVDVTFEELLVSLAYENGLIVCPEQPWEATARVTPPSTGLQYAWMRNNEILPIEQDAKLNTSEPGSYSVIVNTDNCTAVSEPVLVINGPSPPKPKISGTGEICEGTSASLSVTDNYEKYKWSSGETSQAIHPATPGLYTVTVKNSGGCWSEASNPIEVKFKLNPEAEVTYVDGLMSTTQQADAYVWYRDDEIIADVVVRTFKPDRTGTYKVAMTLNGCTVISPPYELVITSVEDNLHRKMEFYPVPTSRFISIDVPFTSSTNFKLRVSSSTGVSQPLDNISSDPERITADLQLLSPGLYTVELQSRDFHIIRRILLK